MTARADVGDPICVPTPRPPASPASTGQETAFGFHDEELVLCSPGYREPTHLAARLFVPARCAATGRCPGALVTHGFGFSKEATIADMQNLANRGFYVLSYDVRGQGASGGQAELMGREEIADEAAVLGWFHRYVKPTKTVVYGISLGGADAWMAAIYNCGAARAAHFDTSIPCDRGGRWVDAIVPMQAPTRLLPQTGTCDVFYDQVAIESRLSDGGVGTAAGCSTDGLAPGVVPSGFHGFDYSVTNYISRVSRIDVPAYVVTSFFDRLVPAEDDVQMWRLLHGRAADSHDPYAGTDVRLTMSNDGHGAVGGNFAVLDDAFNWVEWRFGLHKPLPAAPVATAQWWAGNTFRFERDWPIPGTVTTPFYLSRTVSQPEATGELLSAPPRGAQVGDTMQNVPMSSSGLAGVPFGDSVQPPARTMGTPGAQLVYLTPPMTTPVEIAGLPRLRVWLRSSAAAGQGLGQLHVALFAVGTNGQATEFARVHYGFRGLGPDPKMVDFPITVASFRLPAGTRLMLQISPTDVAASIPARTTASLTIVHDAQHPSALRVPLAPVHRRPPPGVPPTGADFPKDGVAAVCKGLGLPCS